MNWETSKSNFVSWQPSAVINEQIREKHGFINNRQYIKHLIANADKIIKHNQSAACKECSNTSQYGDNKASKEPYSEPYGYENSDLKMNYLTRQNHIN